MSTKLNRLRSRHRHAEAVIKLLHKTLNLQSREIEKLRKEHDEVRATLDRVFSIDRPSSVLGASMYRFALTMSKEEARRCVDPQAVVMYMAKRMAREMGLYAAENAARRIG